MDVPGHSAWSARCQGQAAGEEVEFTVAAFVENDRALAIEQKHPDRLEILVQPIPQSTDTIKEWTTAILSCGRLSRHQRLWSRRGCWWCRRRGSSHHDRWRWAGSAWFIADELFTKSSILNLDRLFADRGEQALRKPPDLDRI